MASMSTKRHWSDLSRPSQALIVGLGVVQVSLAAASWVDLARRPAEEVRGSKGLWALLTAVDFVGPLAYFTYGIRRD